MSALLTGFARVTRRSPCPVCKKPDWCMVSRESEPSKAICQRVESSHRWGNAGWLHRLDARSDGCASTDPEAHVVRWSEDGEEHEIIVHVNRWTKRGKDRLYVAAVLPEGGTRELGNYDLIQGRWYTKGTIKDLSRERQAATKALVLRIASTCTTGGNS